jgi:hypothetical protein
MTPLTHPGTTGGRAAAEHDPAELLSASRVAGLLHVRKPDVLDMLAAGSIPSVTLRGKRLVPRWMLTEWQASLRATGEGGAVTRAALRDAGGTAGCLGG